MIQDSNPVPRIPLGVLVDATDAAARAGAGKKYRLGQGQALEAVDERFSLEVLPVDGASIAAAVAAHPQWCGVLLDDGLRRADAARDTGWAATLSIDDAVLPVEFIGHLRDEQAGESFVARVLTCSSWRAQAAPPTLPALQAFFAQHKYLLMSRHIGSYQQVGQWLANPDQQPLDALARQVITAIMAALRRPATRGGHGNALAHVRGYLKNHLSAGEQVALDEALEWYRLGLVPLHTPLDLLREYFERHPHPYIEQQVYMRPRLHARFDVAALQEELRGTGLRHSAGDR